MSRKEREKLFITVAVLLIVGAALALYIRRGQAIPVLTLAADLLFTQGSVVLIWGIIRSLGNMHAFTSVGYGFRRMHDVLRGRQMKGDKMKDDYLKYRDSRPQHSDAKTLIIISLVLIAGSLVLSLIAA